MPRWSRVAGVVRREAFGVRPVPADDGACVGRKLAITVEPLKTLTTTQRRELDEQVERVGACLEGTPQLTIGTVTVGAHA